MNYIVKAMTIHNYDNVIQLWKNTENIWLHETDEKEHMKRFLKRNRDMSCIAILNKEIIGAVLCSHDGRRGYLHHLAVKKQYRKKGVGTKLLEYCIDKLKKENIIKCNIFIIEENDPGFKFWQKQGFSLLPHFGWMQKQIN